MNWALWCFWFMVSFAGAFIFGFTAFMVATIVMLLVYALATC